MQIIGNQIIASTHLDKHGDRLTSATLAELKRQLPDPYIMYQGHDLSKPPSGKIYNLRLQTLSDGETALVGDMELWDDQLRVEAGGLSLSFSQSSKLTDGAEEPDVMVFMNPRLLDIAKVEEDLSSVLESHRASVQITALYQKGVETVAIVVVSFALLGIAQGFFGEIGADLYRKLKSGLRNLSSRLSRESGQELVIQCKYTLARPSGEVIVIVVVDSQALILLESQPVDIDESHRYLDEIMGDSKLSKAVVRIRSEPPHWEIIQVVDANGRLVKLS